MRQGFRRVPVPQPAQQRHIPYTFVAPTRGWIENENLAAGMPGGAKVLENWFPTQTGARLRGGSRRRATLPSAVRSLFSYEAGNLKRMFATTETAIYDVSNIEDAHVTPAPVVANLKSGYFSTIPLVNANGQKYLIAVNGSDDPLLFDGVNWQKLNATSVPSLRGADVTTLSHVWKYRNRVYYIATGTMSAWYVKEVNSVGGQLVELPLSGVFKNGGSLLLGATWSVSVGNGIDEKCVFISTNGEVVIFEGGSPELPDWRKAGQYDTPPPLGKNATTQVGGDLLIMTVGGIIPITQVITKDSAALSLAAITRSIDPEWRKEVLSRSTLPWEILKWPTMNMGIIAMPTTPGRDPYCFVVNLQTGAWCKYTGWDTRCVVLHDGWGYFGTSDGRVLQCEIGGYDDGAVYECRYTGLFESFGSVGYTKTIHMARATFRASKAINPKVSVSTNYAVRYPPAPDAALDTSASSNWDVGLWDRAKWDGASALQSLSLRWVSIGETGFAVAPQLQVTAGGRETPDAELITMDVIYEVGGMVV